MNDDMWYNTCETQQTTTSSISWKILSWKNIVRFFFYHAKDQEGSLSEQQPCWRMCGDHVHVFFWAKS